MEIERIKVWNHDELKGIGSGVRTIDVKRGRKWLYYRENKHFRWNRLLVKTFERLGIETKIGMNDE